VNTEKTAPPVRNWKSDEMVISPAMRAALARATASQAPIVALTTNVQVSKAIAG
jgi:hypothetical protein